MASTSHTSFASRQSRLYIPDIVDASDHLGLVQKASRHAVRNQNPTIPLQNDGLSVAGFKWLNRAEGSAFRDADLCDDARHHYREKLLTLSDRDRIDRNARKQKSWKAVKRLARDYRLEDQIETAGSRYDQDFHRIQQELQNAETNRASEQVKERLRHELNHVSRGYFVNKEPTAENANSMAKQELVKFCSIPDDAEHLQERIDSATKAIFWGIKARELYRERAEETIRARRAEDL